MPSEILVTKKYILPTLKSALPLLFDNPATVLRLLSTLIGGHQKLIHLVWLYFKNMTKKIQSEIKREDRLSTSYAASVACLFQMMFLLK